MNCESKQKVIVHAAGRYLKLLERDNWEFASRANASGVVVLVPVTDDKQILLVEQYRTPVEARVIELPAGLVGDKDNPDEDLATAADRELLEETGYRAQRFSLLLQCPSSSGTSDEIVTFLRADGLDRVAAGGGDESEDIELHVVPLAGIDDWLNERLSEGYLIDPKIYAALYWLKFPEAAPSMERP